MLEDAICNVKKYSINYLTFYDTVEKLIEAAWLMKQKEGKDKTVFSLPGARGKLKALIQLLAVTISPERIFRLSPRIMKYVLICSSSYFVNGASINISVSIYGQSAAPGMGGLGISNPDNYQVCSNATMSSITGTEQCSTLTVVASHVGCP